MSFLRSSLLLVLLVVPVPALAQLAHGIPDLCATSTDNVAHGSTVTLSGTVSKGCLGIHGIVHLANNVQLTADTILVYSDGVLDTTSTPGTGIRITFRDFAIDTGADPDQWGHGLIGLGQVTLKGTPITPFLRVTGELAANATSLTLASSPTGWATGNRLILPGTNQSRPNSIPASNQWEELTASSVSGATIGVNALTFAHGGSHTNAGVLTDLPHVGNLSRSIVIISANPSGVRGHVLFSDRANVDLEYVALKDLGRTTIVPLDATTNHIGRYSLHFHHLTGPVTPQSNGYQFTAIGNAIDGGSKWGITLHNAHYGIVQDNVVYNCPGAGIMTEDGSETGNLIDHNFVVRTIGTGDDRADQRQATGDWGYEGSALWFRGPNNRVTNNVLANANAYGVTYMMVGIGTATMIPTAQGADPMVSGTAVNMMATPILAFSNNEMYGLERGLTVWNLGAECCAAVFELPVSTFLNTTLWNVGRLGYYGYGSNRITFDGWRQYGDVIALSNANESVRGFFFGDYLARNTIIRNTDLQNLAIGVWLPPKMGDTRDLYGTAAGTLLVENSSLTNVFNVLLELPWGVTGGGGALPPRAITFRNDHFVTPSGNLDSRTPLAIVTSYQLNNPNPNAIVRTDLNVERYNGVANDSFQVYFTEQASTFVVPQNNAVDGLVGAPVAGLTNAQTMATYGIAISGAVTPCTTTRPEIQGFVCGGTVVADTTAPTVSVTAPTGTVSGIQTVTASAFDNIGVAGVQFRVDGILLGSEVTAAPYQTTWNTGASSNASHTLTAIARDAAGNTTTSAGVVVTVSNPVADVTAPSVSITAPAAGNVSGTVAITATATDNIGVAGVQFKIDAVPFSSEQTVAPYSVPWDTTTLPDGSHVLTATARDAAGNVTTSSTVTVTIANTIPDVTAPSVSVTAPAAAATVAGTQTVTATATDATGVVGVQFKLDGVLLGAEDTSAPYSVSWDTTRSTNATHDLTAIARDAAGNVGTSSTVTVTVSNAAADTTPPAVSVTAPTGTVSGVQTLTATATDAVGVVGVQFKVDGVLVGNEDLSAPYTASWDTRLVANGSHVLTAVARDAAVNVTTSSPVTVTVSNTDTTAPSVTWTDPTAGATVSGPVTLTVSATDAVGVVGVIFKVDGVQTGTEVVTAPYSLRWTSSTVTDGGHTLTATARDAAGNTSTATRSVTVANGIGAENFSAVLTVQTCKIVMTATPPDNFGGWTATFRSTTTPIPQTASDSVPPYSRTVMVSPGSYTLSALWTKKNTTQVSSSSVTVSCR